MAFGWGSAAAGASDALQQLIAQRMEEQYKAAQMAAQQAQLEQQGAQFNANQAMQREQLARLTKADERDESYRQREEGRTEADRRQVQNQRGVRSMVLEGLRAKTTDPRTAQLMAAGEGVDLGMDVLDPEKEQRDRMALMQESRRQSRLTANTRTASSPDQEWVIRGGKPVPIPKGTAQPGDTPYDPVAARSAQPTNQSEAVDTAREVQRIARSLRGHSGLPGTFGVVSSRMPTIRQGTADAETLLNSLQGLLTIENMGKMKGVLSDADMRILRQASTTLDAKMSESAARAELMRLEQVMSKLTGIPAGDGGDGSAGSGTLAPGTKGTVNGVPAVWDGNGWLPAGQE